MLVLSHRGEHRQLPENTLSAFAAAVDQGIDGIETDIRLLADGQLALFHDSHVPDGRAVAGLSLPELRAATGRVVPLLGEALERWPEILWNLEIKAVEAVEPLLKLLGGVRLRRRPMISSFWHQVIAQVSEHNDLDVAYLVAHRPADIRRDVAPWWPATRAQRVVVWKSEFIDEETIATAKHLGIANWVFGLYTLEEHRHAAQWGADALITDRIDWGFAWRRAG